MKRNIWFKEKKLGWGWTPVTWQGWVVTVLFVLYELGLSAFIGNSFDSRSGVTSFLFLSFLGVLILLVICFKFGETPHLHLKLKK